MVPTAPRPMTARRRLARPIAACCAALACLAILALAWPGGPAWAGTPAGEPAQSPRRFAAGQVLVKLRPGTAAAQAAAVIREHGLEQVDAIEAIGWRRLRAPEGREEETAARLLRNPNVLAAETNGIIGVQDTNPNDVYFANLTQWNVRKVLAPQAWDVVTGSLPITIALIDTGVDGAHPDLVAQMVDGFYQYTDAYGVYSGTIPAGTKNDPHGHGTHVAGILGATTNNSTGVAGMHWGARIMPFRSQRSDGNGEDFDVAAGLVWVVDHGAQVVNISLGGADYNQALADAAAYAWSNGVLVVAAGGNRSGPLPTYPAAYTDVLGIGPTGQSDEWVNFGTTSYGTWIDAAAPGSGIISTYLWNGYTWLSGTSMASPLVAGLAALIWSANPALTNAQVARVITATADKVGTTPYVDGWNEYLGHGRVNAREAAGAALLGLSGPAVAHVGAPITYQITLIAGAKAPTGSVALTNALPAGAGFGNASDGGALVEGVVRWDLGLMPPGTVATRTLVVTATGDIVNDAYGAAGAGGPLARGVFPVRTLVGPRLAVAKTGPASVLAGEPITYTLVVSNTGVQAASGLVLTDVLPAGAWFVSASDGGGEAGGLVSWSVPLLAPGESLTRTLVVTSAAGLTNHDYAVSCAEGNRAAGVDAVRTAVLSYRYFWPMLTGEGLLP